MDMEQIASDIGPRLYRYFYPEFGSTSAEDMVQEVFIRLIPKIQNKKILSSKGSISMYAYGIARNVRREFLKKNKNGRFYPDSLETVPEVELHRTLSTGKDDIIADIDNTLSLNRLRTAINSLSKHEKEAILLLIDWNLNHEQIARIMKMPVGTVKSHLHRAKIHLKQLFTPHTPVNLTVQNEYTKQR